MSQQARATDCRCTYSIVAYLRPCLVCPVRRGGLQAGAALKCETLEESLLGIVDAGWQKYINDGMAGSLTAQESGHPSAVMECDMNGLAVSRKVDDQVEMDPRCFSACKSP
jgi:hypothetical protein